MKDLHTLYLIKINGKLTVLEERNDFSIGEVYWAVHRYLQLSDEGSLMGLAGYGTPKGTFDKVANAEKLQMDFSKISRPGIGGGMAYSQGLVDWLGKPRLEHDEISEGLTRKKTTGYYLRLFGGFQRKSQMLFCF